jgi:sugar O-acyltransferase (sialic acid O-acetyltransferase NeuD family)
VPSGPLTVFAVATPYAWDVVESAVRRGRSQQSLHCVDNLGGADPRLPGLERLTDDTTRAPFVLGVASADHRVPAAVAAHEAGFKTPEVLVDPTAVLPRTAQLRHGAYVNAGAVLGSHVELGCHAHVNRAATVGHDAVLGFGASIGPGAVLAGHVVVGPAAFVGAGATVLPEVRIGRRAIVGAGAVVTSDVGDHEVVVGNPARVLKRRDEVAEIPCPHC